MLTWLKQFAKNPLGIGAIAPSSPFLADLMTRNIKNTDIVLELGPGNGAITKVLLDRIPPSQLTLVEQDPVMAKLCQNHFQGIQLFETDAATFFQQHPEQYDTIVSGIPFAAIPKQKRALLFTEIARHLKPGGNFIMFQYSLTTRKELDQHFVEVKTKFTPLNLPPAFVFVGRAQ